jgi:hypothetical protein
MAFDYEAMAGRVVELLERYGTIVQLEKIATGGPKYDPVNVPTTEDLIGVLSKYKDKDIDGTRILRKDRRVILAADQSEPTTADFVRIAGVQYSIIDVEKIEPASTILAYVLQVRA